MATATSCLPRTTVAGGASAAVACDGVSIESGKAVVQAQTCICVHLCVCVCPHEHNCSHALFFLFFCKLL